jgi:hypothetical protein
MQENGLSEEIRRILASTNGFTMKEMEQGGKVSRIFFIEHIVNRDILNRDLLPFVAGWIPPDIEPEQELMQRLPTGTMKIAADVKEAAALILRGWVVIHPCNSSKLVAVHADHFPVRRVENAQTEAQVLGPSVGFTESLDLNIGILQSYIFNKDLTFEAFTVGRRTQTPVSLCYIEGFTNETAIQTFRQRIKDLDIDSLIDSHMLVQYIDDNSSSIFPLFIVSERLDRAVVSLMEGKILVLTGGSPFVIIGPSVFLDFLKSTEDHYLRWHMASFIRILRFVAIVISLFFTPVYVAALTYHYEIIPQALLSSLAQSRTKVPFPPLFEAFFLESIIELLREAGARLPSKVGQTMGIVGGIVIGQAAVQAGFTSNILIMIVALGALASFTVPNYSMSSALRIIRFPMILLAGIWGGIGITVGLCFLLLHLLRQSSLGFPYLSPVYPFRSGDIKDSLIRLPYSFLRKRNQFTRPQDKNRFPRGKFLSSLRKHDIYEEPQPDPAGSP